MCPNTTHVSIKHAVSEANLRDKLLGRVDLEGPASELLGPVLDQWSVPLRDLGWLYLCLLFLLATPTLSHSAILTWIGRTSKGLGFFSNLFINDNF